MNNLLTVADGDFYTQARQHLDEAMLQRYKGATKALCLKILKLNQPAVYNTHLDFLRAGAKIIKTNTKATSPSLMTRHLGLEGPEAMDLIKTAVKLAQKAVLDYYEETGGDASNKEEYTQRRSLVAGSCGSYEWTELNAYESQRYWEWVDEEDIRRCYKQRMQTLLNAGVDLLILEEISCRMEALIILELLKGFGNVRAWLTFTCVDAAYMEDGSDFFELALQCYRDLPEQIVAIGAVYDYNDNDVNLVVEMYSQIPEAERFPLLCFFSREIVYDATLLRYLGTCASLGVQYIMGNVDTGRHEVQNITAAVAERFRNPPP